MMILPSTRANLFAFYFCCALQLVSAATWTMYDVASYGATRTTYNNPRAAASNTSQSLITLIGAASLAERYADITDKKEYSFLVINPVHFPAGPVVTGGKKGKKSAVTAAPVVETGLSSDVIQEKLAELYEDFTAAYYVSKNLVGFMDSFCKRLCGEAVEGKTLDSPLFDQIKAFKLVFSAGKFSLYSYLTFNEAEDPNYELRMVLSSQVSSLFPTAVPALLEQNKSGFETIIDLLKRTYSGPTVDTKSPSKSSGVITTQPGALSGKSHAKAQGKAQAVAAPPSEPELSEAEQARLREELIRSEEEKQQKAAAAQKAKQDKKKKADADRRLKLEAERQQKEAEEAAAAKALELQRQEQSARDKKARQDKLEAERLAKEEKEKKIREEQLEQRERERAERERIEREQAEQKERERIAREEQLRLKRESEERERVAREEQLRLKREREEQQRLEREARRQQEEESKRAAAAKEQEKLRKIEEARLKKAEEDRAAAAKKEAERAAVVEANLLALEQARLAKQAEDERTAQLAARLAELEEQARLKEAAERAEAAERELEATRLANQRMAARIEQLEREAAARLAAPAVSAAAQSGSNFASPLSQTGRVSSSSPDSSVSSVSLSPMSAPSNVNINAPPPGFNSWQQQQQQQASDFNELLGRVASTDRRMFPAEAHQRAAIPFAPGHHQQGFFGHDLQIDTFQQQQQPYMYEGPLSGRSFGSQYSSSGHFSQPAAAAPLSNRSMNSQYSAGNFSPMSYGNAHSNGLFASGNSRPVPAPTNTLNSPFQYGLNTGETLSPLFARSATIASASADDDDESTEQIRNQIEGLLDD